MKNPSKTKKELIEESDSLRQKVADYERMEAACRIAEKRMQAVNECLLSLGNDMGENIRRLTALTGELIDATAAIYNRLEGDLLITIGQWQTPPDFRIKDRADGHICYDVIRKNEKRIIHIRNLAESSYAESDPNIRAYGLATYIGHVVRWGSKPVGSLCVVFQHDFIPTADDERLLGIMAALIGAQEKRWRNENALQASEATLRTLINAPTDSILLLDTQGAILDLNNVAAERLEKNRNELIGTLADNHLPDNIAKRRRSMITQVLETGKTVRFEDERDGKWYDTVAYPIPDKEGAVNRLAIIARDMTERKRAENALQESEVRYRGLLTHLATSVVVHAPDTSVIMNNPSASKLLGLSEDQIKGKRAIDPQWKFISETNVPLRLEEYPVNRIVASKKPIENQLCGVYRPATNDIVWAMVNGSPVLDNNGEISEIVISFIDITERKRVEEALKKSEEILRLITDNMSDMIRVTDLQGVNLFTSPSHFKGLGYRMEERVGKSAFDIVHPDDRERIITLFKEGITAKRRVNVEYRVRHAEGHYIWLETVADLLRDAQGKATSVVMSSRDISNRKQAEEALRDEHWRLESIIEGTHVGTWEWNVQTGKTVFNETWAQIIGYTRDELSPICIKTWEAFAHPDDLKQSGELLERHFANELPYYDIECRMKHKNGRWVWVHDRGKVVTWTADGKPLLMFGTHTDITDRKKAEEALRVNEQRYRDLYENLRDGSALVNIEGRIIQCNNRFLAMLGYAFEEVAQLSYDNITPVQWHAGEREILQRQVQRRGYSDLYEKEYIRKDGSIFPVELQTYLVKDNKGNFAGYWAFVRNITDRKRAEEEKRKLEERLQRAEKMEALGTLAGGVAHDLNNVLGVIVGYAELLLYEVDKLSPIRPRLTKIMNGSEKAAAIVQDLLTLARRGVPGRKILNLNKIILDYQNSPEFEKLSSYHFAVRIKLDLESGLLNISGSSVHLGKALSNLVANAAEAMPKGGDLTIKTTNQYLDKPIYGYDKVREGDYVVLSVTDTGEGIPPEDLQRIFEPFYTKKVMGRSGTGLGLAVIWGTVKDHQGYINVQSAEGEGSTFTLYFPVTREEISTDAATISISEYMGKGEVILIVDDVREQRDLAAEMLKKLNYKVSIVSSGEEAIDYIKKHKVDLLVLDMIMDPGMDGLDTYRGVLEIQRKQKAIIVSGFSESERVNEAHALGAGEYVKKPYVIEKLGLAVRRELDRAT